MTFIGAGFAAVMLLGMSGHLSSLDFKSSGDKLAFLITASTLARSGDHIGKDVKAILEGLCLWFSINVFSLQPSETSAFTDVKCVKST